jgi:hypothetical protein
VILAAEEVPELYLTNSVVFLESFYYELMFTSYPGQKRILKQMVSVFPIAQQPPVHQASSLSRLHDHTQTHHIQ